MTEERKITVEDTPAEPEPKVTTTETTTTTEPAEDDGKDTSNEENES